MKHILTPLVVAITIATSPTFAGENEDANKALAMRALTEMFDAQNVELIDELYHPDYIQHSPLIADGRKGIRAGVTWMKENGMVPVREVARIVAQDNMVGIQARVTLGGKTAIVGDIFRIQDGQIIEHWDATQTETPKAETASGNSMIDGGGDASADVSAEDLARNAKIATEFFAKGIAGDVETIKRSIGDEYIQHNPKVPNGIDAILGFFKDSDGTLGNVTVHRTISEGDLTFALVEYADWGNFVIEVVRHDANGLIVEHWDIVQPIPSEMAHDNGLF